MDRLEAFEKMLADIQKQAAYEKNQLKIMKAEEKKRQQHIDNI